MCGLVAIYSYGSNSPVSREELICIRDSMRVRGPDGEGAWISNDGRIGLGHRRLAVIDLNERAAQPMASADDRLRIVFNGEIYNYLELRRGLEAEGVQFRTESDTEVLLAMYRKYGREMARHLRGMFAFTIWDADRRGLLLARDPFGIKPLYFSDHAGVLRVASQVKGLMSSGEVPSAVSSAGVVGFYLWGSVPEPFTIYDAISAVPAGATIWVGQDGRRDAQTYFDVRQEIVSAWAHPSGLSDVDARLQLKEALHDSIEHHLVSDVPVGIFLSAGIDSGVLLALAREVTGSELHAVTLGFREFEGSLRDETIVASAVAEQYGARHFVHRFDRNDFHHELENIIAAMDQPSIDGVNTYFVCKAARENGVKVAMSGLGADEIFRGYSSFTQIPRLASSMGFFASRPALGARITQLLKRSMPKGLSPKYAGLAEYGGTVDGAYLLRRGLFMPWEISEEIESRVVSEGLEALRTKQHLAAQIDGVSDNLMKVTALETCWYMRNQLLRDSDWASMAHSIELRVPYVDPVLFRAVIRFAAQGHRPDKRLLSGMPSTSLPVVALNRRKTGFTVPVEEWVTRGRSGKRPGGLRPWARDVAAANGVKSVRNLRSSAPRIALFASDVAAHGGIPSFMRRIWEAWSPLSLSGRYVQDCFCLNDRQAEIEAIREREESRLVGAAGSKIAYVLRLIFGQRIETAIVGHVGLAPVALAMKLAGRLDGYYVQLHGIEAWKRLPVVDRFALRYADGILATTRYTADECAKLNDLPSSRFVIIPLCAAALPTAIQGRSLLRGSFKLLCVSRQDRSERYKGFEMLLSAMAELRAQISGIHLNLVGSGNDQEWLRQRAADIGVTEDVTFLGPLTNEDLMAVYSECDVFVMPSKKEGFGIVFLEAMAFAKPCIGGAHGGTPEVITHGESGFLVRYEDVASLVRHTLELAKDEGLRTRMGRKGYALVRDRFSKRRFDSSYQRLVGGVAGVSSETAASAALIPGDTR